MESSLYFGDNLWVLEQVIPEASVDLVYLDPPFNSKAQYNLLYETPSNMRETAQRTVFRDTWSWGEEAEYCFRRVLAQGGQVASIVNSLTNALGRSDTMAYLVMMAARLIQVRRVLRTTGSLYLHCDPTASHYLKVVLDSLFGPSHFRSEISWRRTSGHNDAKQGRAQYGNVRDVILFYTCGDEWTWNQQYTPYDDAYLENEYRHGKHLARPYKETDVTAAKPGGDTSYIWRVKRRAGKKERWQPDFRDEYRSPKEGWEYKGVPPYQGRFWAYSKENLRAFWEEGRLIHRATGMPRLMQYIDEMPGVPLQNDWQGIKPTPKSEALGYPTQKPLALLRRIIETSSNPGDVVLDPFCGCGTTVHAAAELRRQWIGIDISYFAVRLVKRRLKAHFGARFDVPIKGIPADYTSAVELAKRDPYGFQQWAVGELGCQLWNDGKKGADTGIDGEMWFFDGPGRPAGHLLAQVKGGRRVGVAAVREFRAVIDRDNAQIGILFCREEPTTEMRREASAAGFHRIGRNRVSRLQIVSLDAWYAGQRPSLPTPIQLSIPKDKSTTSKKRSRRPDPNQPEFSFVIEGSAQAVPAGRVMNPEVIPDEAILARDA